MLRGDVVALFPDAELTVDALEFERLARLAAEHEDADLARDALAWYAGELLPADRYEDWAADRRELALRRLDLLRVSGSCSGGAARPTLVTCRRSTRTGSARPSMA